MSNVVLTGFMGTGKTTVGRALAEALDYEFVDTDELIELRHGPISQIFDTRGEDAFRKIERAIAAEVAGRDRQVVATGGRLMLDPENANRLQRNGRVFCLAASPEEVLRRVGPDTGRPLLAGADRLRRIVALYAEREAGYLEFEQVETVNRTVEQVVADLVARLGGPGFREST